MTQSRAVDLTDNLCTKQGNVGLKSGVYNQDQFQIKSGFKSREAYNGMCMVFMKPKNCYNSLLKFERNKAEFAFQILTDANISCDHLSSFHNKGMTAVLSISDHLYIIFSCCKQDHVSLSNASQLVAAQNCSKVE